MSSQKFKTKDFGPPIQFRPSTFFPLTYGRTPQVYQYCGGTKGISHSRIWNINTTPLRIFEYFDSLV